MMGLAITASGLSGCAMGRVGPGSVQERYVVDASGRDQADARRKAVSSFFDAYLSTAAQTASSDVLERTILSNTSSYIVRDKVLSTKKEGGPEALRLRALIDYLKLGKDLEAAGLIKPQGVLGTPRAAVALSSREAGESLQRVLAARGYDAVLMSPEATLDQARERGAAIIVSGEAGAALSDDAALAGFRRAGARADLKVYALPKGEVVDDFSVEASAVDLDSDTARAKALENCGLLASDKLERYLKSRFVERDETSVVVLGVGKLAEVEKLLGAVRSSRGVAGAALSAMGGGDSRLRVFTERMSADELAATMLRLPGYSLTVRFVEPALREIELDTAGEAPF